SRRRHTRSDRDWSSDVCSSDLPFASKVRTTWNGEEVGVMHACGHDCHTAILMGVAEILAGLRAELRGTVKFIFQPAEELPPEGEDRKSTRLNSSHDQISYAVFC